MLLSAGRLAIYAVQCRLRKAEKEAAFSVILHLLRERALRTEGSSASLWAALWVDATASTVKDNSFPEQDSIACLGLCANPDSSTGLRSSISAQQSSAQSSLEELACLKLAHTSQHRGVLTHPDAHRRKFRFKCLNYSHGLAHLTAAHSTNGSMKT